MLTTNDEIVAFQKLPPNIRRDIIKIACEVLFEDRNYAQDNVRRLDQNLGRITRQLMQDFVAEQEAGFTNIKTLAINAFNDQVFNILIGVLATN